MCARLPGSVHPVFVPRSFYTCATMESKYRPARCVQRKCQNSLSRDCDAGVIECTDTPVWKPKVGHMPWHSAEALGWYSVHCGPLFSTFHSVRRSLPPATNRMCKCCRRRRCCCFLVLLSFLVIKKKQRKLESVRRCQNSLVLVVLAICIMISADAGFLRTFPRTAFKTDNDVATECLGDGWHCGVTRSRLISHSVTIYARHISR